MGPAHSFFSPSHPHNLSPCSCLHSLQRIADQDVREEWEIEQAQDKAMALHHKQMEAAPSRCA